MTDGHPITPSAHPIQPLLEDSRGVQRFKANQIVRHLLDTHPTCDLNKLACMDFSDGDQQQFAQLIGYSLSGYGELSYVSDANYAAAEASAISPMPQPMTELHYEWELEDADGEWQAGGSSNFLEDARREGTHYLTQYSNDGYHKLIIREHCTRTIQEITND